MTTSDEIDLHKVASALKRRWRWLLTATLAGGFTSSLITLSTSTVWEGEFQIVLSQNESTSGSLDSLRSSNPILASLTSANGSSLQTEVKILESPSVLMPVFNFVKETKKANGVDITSMHFAKWFNESVKVDLEKGTSVLSITYRDTDKDIILPVLKHISNTYQQYSGLDRSESINNALTHTSSQVELLRKNAKSSNRALDAFSLRYGIAKQGNYISGTSTGYIAAKSVGIAADNGNALSQLATINQEIIRKQQIFKENDPSVLALIRERDGLRRYIELTAGGSLTLPEQQTLNKQQAQEIILKFKELERTAMRDVATLDSLEKLLLNLQIEKAKSIKPWELISTPTLLSSPVYPRPARNLAIGLLGGFVVGSTAGLSIDRRRGQIYSKDEIEQAVPTTLLAELPISTPEVWHESLHLLVHHSLQGCSVGLIPMGEIDASYCCILVDSLLTSGLDNVRLCPTVLEAEGFDQKILLACTGSCKRKELKRLLQDLRLQQQLPLGLIWLDLSEDA